MVWSNWKVALVWMFAGAGLAWSQTPPPASTGSTPERIMAVHENGKNIRCRVLQSWTLPDGKTAHQLQALESGELISIIDDLAPGDPRIPEGKKSPKKIYHWGQKDQASNQPDASPIQLTSGQNPTLEQSQYIAPGNPGYNPVVQASTPSLNSYPGLKQVQETTPSPNTLTPNPNFTIEVPGNTAVQEIDQNDSSQIKSRLNRIKQKMSGSNEVVTEIVPMPSNQPRPYVTQISDSARGTEAPPLANDPKMPVAPNHPVVVGSQSPGISSTINMTSDSCGCDGCQVGPVCRPSLLRRLFSRSGGACCPDGSYVDSSSMPIMMEGVATQGTMTSLDFSRRNQDYSKFSSVEKPGDWSDRRQDIQPARNPSSVALKPGDWPLGSQSVIAARSGLVGQVTYVPVPTVTVPRPIRPPEPPSPSVPQAPQSNSYVNAFTAPPQPSMTQDPSQNGMAAAMLMRSNGAGMSPYGPPMMPQGGGYATPAGYPATPIAPMMNMPRNYPGPGAPNLNQAVSPVSYTNRPGMAPGYPVQADPTFVLIRTLRESPYPAQREWAAQTLGTMDGRAFPQIVTALQGSATQDPAPNVRAGSVYALSRLNVGPDAVVPTITIMQQDPDPRVRQEVSAAIARLNRSPVLR